MSIINEALKKTEQSIHKNAAKEALPSGRKLAIKHYVIYILILIAGLFLSNFIFTLISAKVKTSSGLNQSLSSTNQPVKEISPILSTAIVTSAPVFKENKTPGADFVLNGIFFSDHNSYALVNNAIVRENDFVDGAKVKTISANTVELDSGDKRITLTTQR